MKTNDNPYDRKAVLDTLNRIMELELAGAVRYTHYALMVYGYNRLPIVAWLQEQASEGLAHARMAGELCDGLRLHPLTTVAYVNDVLLPAVEAGARKAGRSLSDIEIVSMPFAITGRTAAEVEAARAQVRMHIAFYASTRTYHAVLRHHGWEEAGLKLHELSLQGRWPEMGQAVTDEMLDHFAVAGTYDEIMPRLKARWAGACDTVFIPLPPGAGGDQVKELVQSFRRA